MGMTEEPLDRLLRVILEEQREGRDHALDNLSAVRSELISEALRVARILAVRQGSVSSTEVFNVMKLDARLAAQMDQVDPRWMGAVFRDPMTWEHVSWSQNASHGRSVKVWKLR